MGNGPGAIVQFIPNGKSEHIHEMIVFQKRPKSGSKSKRHAGPNQCSLPSALHRGNARNYESNNMQRQATHNFAYGRTEFLPPKVCSFKTSLNAALLPTPPQRINASYKPLSINNHKSAALNVVHTPKVISTYVVYNSHNKQLDATKEN